MGRMRVAMLKRKNNVRERKPGPPYDDIVPYEHSMTPHHDRRTKKIILKFSLTG
jgi:hypothetical protein